MGQVNSTMQTFECPHCGGTLWLWWYDEDKLCGRCGYIGYRTQPLPLAHRVGYSKGGRHTYERRYSTPPRLRGTGKD